MAGQLLYIKGDKMVKLNVQFTKDNEYYTPKNVVKYFGDFEYDPATCKEKAEEFNIKEYDTIETDGLTKDWTKYKRIWINPPFTDKAKFLAKAVETYTKVHNEIYILFPIEFITTRIFHQTVDTVGGEIYVPNGRINFESGLGKKPSGCAFGTVIMKIKDKKDNWKLKLIDKNFNRGE